MRGRTGPRAESGIDSSLMRVGLRVAGYGTHQDKTTESYLQAGMKSRRR